MSSLEEHYRVLDIAPTASLEEIRTVYRDLAQVWHPDRFEENPRLREKAEVKLKAINLAYETIREQHRSEKGAPAREQRAPKPKNDGRSADGTGTAGSEPMSETDLDALGWYGKAAMAGHPDAQCIVANMYADGDGVPRDEAKAIAWFKRSAALGHPAAEFQLGLRYYSGGGLPRDPAKARELYERAAYKGHARSQFNLGLMFSNGMHVAQDKAVACAWFTLASEAGHAEAEALLESMSKTLAAEEKEQAQRELKVLRRRVK